MARSFAVAAVQGRFEVHLPGSVQGASLALQAADFGEWPKSQYLAVSAIC
jgi:hypothetical protein